MISAPYEKMENVRLENTGAIYSWNESGSVLYLFSRVLSECDKSYQVNHEKEPVTRKSRKRACWTERTMDHICSSFYSSILELPGSRKWGNHHHTIFITIVCRKEINVLKKYLAHVRWLRSEYFYSSFTKAQSSLWRVA